MNSFKLACFNVKNNLRLFNFNVASMAFAIAVFFNFFSLLFNPTLNLDGSDTLLIKATIYMTSILLVFFVIFFVFYSNAFFLKQRKREIGIYLFMGIEPARIAWVFALEQVLLGALALLSGLLAGIIFQKAFLMLLTRMAAFKTGVEFHLSLPAMGVTGGVFFLIFALAGALGFGSIQRSRLIDLLSAEKHAESAGRQPLVTGVLSILLLLAGFYFSQDVFNEYFLLNGGLVMICLILGTFLFFRFFCPLILRLLTREKRILYHGTHLISLSNLTYRIRQNYRTLAFMTLIVAATMTALGVSLSVQHILSSTLDIAYPYTFSFVSGDTPNKEALKARVTETIRASQHPILLEIETPYLVFDSQRYTQGTKNHPVIKQSDAMRISQQLAAPNRQAFQQAVQNLADGAALSVASSNDIGFKSRQRLNLYGLPIQVTQTFSTPLLGSRFVNNTLILTEHDYQMFREKCQQQNPPEKERIFLGFTVERADDSLALSNALAALPELKNNFTSYISYYQAYNRVTGTVKFTGFFLGVVFMISTACIMYMKWISDAIGDQQQYEVLMKLGMNERELRGAISKQVGFSYLLPLLAGAFYAFMAIRVLQEFLNRFFEISLLVPFWWSVGISGVVYGVFYVFTTQKFVHFIQTRRL